MDELIHIRLSKELKKQINDLIAAGLFTSQTEVAREALRTLILKYREEVENLKKQKNAKT